MALFISYFNWKILYKLAIKIGSMERVLIFLLITFELFSQPTLNISDIFPFVGEVFTLKTCEYKEPGAGGQNVIWDFSSLNILDSVTQSVLSPTATPYSNYFAGATIASKDIGSENIYAYFKKENTAYNFLGYAQNSNCIVKYTDPLTYFNFPLSYNYSFNDQYYSQFTCNGIQHTLKGYYSYIVDGYGTLKTPFGVFNNVLRLKIHKVQIDSINYSGMVFVMKDTVHSWLWLKAGFHNSLLTINELINNGNITKSTIICEFPTYISINENYSISLYPNPVIDYLFLTMNFTPGFVEVKIYNNLGNIIYNKSYTNIFQNLISINLTDLSQGFYFIEINIDNNYTKRMKFFKK